MEDFTLGNIRITRVPEMINPSAAARDFFPEYEEELYNRHKHWLEPKFIDPVTQQLLIYMQSWVIRTEKHTILVDSCIGNDKDRDGVGRFHMLNTPYLQRLKGIGVNPEDVDFVLCTHLHVDHVGWNTRLENGRWVPTFPNAKYLMSRVEHDHWHHHAQLPDTSRRDKNIYNDSILPVVEAGLTRFIDGEDAIEDRLTIHPCPGHTPGHVRLDLASLGKQAIFSGDVVQCPLQVPLWFWNSKFCIDRAQSAKSRKEVLATCAERHALFVPAHFADPFVAYINAKGDSFELDFDVGH